jgi:hypothetical protein
MNRKNLSLRYFVRKLHQREPFTFSRWGDGEVLTLLGGPYLNMRNSNGCTFTPALSEDLQRVLKNNHPYYKGLLGIANRKKGDELEAWLSNNSVSMRWYNGDLFLDASLNGNLFPLIEEIRERRVLYIGNERLKGLNHRGKGFFPYTTYIEPPAQNSHEVKERLLYEVRTAIRKHKIGFIGWSAGLASKVFIDDIYGRFPEVTQIDFGSLFDGYFTPLDHIQAMGRTGSRSYIRKGGHDWEQLLKDNTEGKNVN